MLASRHSDSAAAPLVLQFSPDGTLLKSWGGPGQGYDWPNSEHGLHIHIEGNVWLAGNDRPARRRFEYREVLTDQYKLIIFVMLHSNVVVIIVGVHTRRSTQ
jgi:hypothetical protein